MLPRKIQDARGFTLIEVAIVIAILGLLITMGAEFTSTYREKTQHTSTEAKLDTIEEALILFAAQHLRLPCPADSTTPATAGVEAIGGTGCAGNQLDGIVPWITLGLPETSVIDAWGNYITYRVSQRQANNPPSTTCPTTADALDGIDLSICAAGAAVHAALEGVGLEISTDSAGTNKIADPNAAALHNGAAYVLISHGPNRWWGRGPGEANVRTPPAAANIAEERANRNDATLNARYVAAPPGLFDDYVRFSTIMQVAWRAKLGPT